MKKKLFTQIEVDLAKKDLKQVDWNKVIDMLIERGKRRKIVAIVQAIIKQTQ